MARRLNVRTGSGDLMDRILYSGEKYNLFVFIMIFPIVCGHRGVGTELLN